MFQHGSLIFNIRFLGGFLLQILPMLPRHRVLGTMRGKKRLAAKLLPCLPINEHAIGARLHHEGSLHLAISVLMSHILVSNGTAARGAPGGPRPLSRV